MPTFTDLHNSNPATALTGAEFFGADQAGQTVGVTGVQLAAFTSAANSLQTRAALLVASISTVVATLQTSGYAAPGDGGGATYNRATGPLSDGASFKTADGAWWQIAGDTVSVSAFGAIGGLAGQGNYGALPDDTTAIQKWLTYIIMTGIAGTVPPRHFRFRLALNAGKTSPFDGVTTRIVGSNLGQSRFIADLTEAFPAIDTTNQNGLRVENLGIDTTPTSLHTCVWLLAETTASGANGARFDNCNFIDRGAVSHYLMYGLTVDQVMLDNCNFTSVANSASASVFFSTDNPSSIASKYWSISSFDADHTVFSAKNSNFLCPNGPGLWVRPYVFTTLTNCYGAVLGSTGHTMGVFRFGSLGLGHSIGVSSIGMRTEDHATGSSVLCTGSGSIAPSGDGLTSVLTSSAAWQVGMLVTGSGVTVATVIIAQLTSTTWTVLNVQTVASETLTANIYSSPAIYIEDYIWESTFTGSLNTSGAGAFGGPGQHINSNVAVQIGYGCFNNAGILEGGRYHFSGAGSAFGGSGYGGVFNVASSYGYQLGGVIGVEAVALATYTTCAAFTDFQYDYVPGRPAPVINGATRVFSGQANTPLNYRIAVQGEAGSVNAAAYVGGSGLATVASVSVSPSFFYFGSNSVNQLVRPVREFTMEGMFNATWAASGQIELILNQAVTGSPNIVLANLTAIAAQSTGASLGFITTCRIYFDGSQWYANTRISIDGSTPVSIKTVLSIGSGATFIFASTVPLVFNLAVNNSGSSPVTALFYVMR